MTTSIRYWLLFLLTLLGAGAAGYSTGDWPSAVVSACAAGVGMLRQSPTDPRQAAM